MKKFFALLLAALLLLSLAACGQPQPYTEATYTLKENQRCLRVFENGIFHIRLPESGEGIAFLKDYWPYLPYITDELVAETEKALATIGPVGDYPIQVQRDEEGYLILKTGEYKTILEGDEIQSSDNFYNAVSGRITTVGLLHQEDKFDAFRRHAGILPEDTLSFVGNYQYLTSYSSDRLPIPGCVERLSSYFLLRLPLCKKTVNLSMGFLPFFPNIDKDLLETAEEEISENTGDGLSPGYYVKAKENHLYLCYEEVEELPEDQWGEEKTGCFDHRHTLYEKRITSRPVTPMPHLGTYDLSEEARGVVEDFLEQHKKNKLHGTFPGDEDLWFFHLTEKEEDRLYSITREGYLVNHTKNCRYRLTEEEGERLVSSLFSSTRTEENNREKPSYILTVVQYRNLLSEKPNGGYKAGETVTLNLQITAEKSPVFYVNGQKFQPTNVTEEGNWKNVKFSFTMPSVETTVHILFE